MTQLSLGTHLSSLAKHFYGSHVRPDPNATCKQTHGSCAVLPNMDFIFKLMQSCLKISRPEMFKMFVVICDWSCLARAG